MNKKSRVVVAFVLTLLLTAAFPAAAFAETTGTISGDSTVDNVVMNVILPTNLNFALDPLGLDTTGDDNQIATQDFFFVNQTLAPVKISVEIAAETSGGAVLVSDPSTLSKDDTSVTDKELFFGALGASGVTGTAITATGAALVTEEAITTYSDIADIYGSSNPPQAEYTTASAVADTLVSFTPGTGGATGSAVIAFALNKAVESETTPGAVDSLATDNKGVAAFQFYSELNTYADWKANDITVSGAYTLTPLRTTTYDNYTYITGGLNQLETTPAEPAEPTYDSAGFIVEGATVDTLANKITSSKASAENISIPFYFDGKTIASLKLSTTTVDAAQYTIDGNNLVLKKDNASYYLKTLPTGDKPFTLTLTDDATSYTFTVTVTD